MPATFLTRVVRPATVAAFAAPFAVLVGFAPAAYGASPSPSPSATSTPSGSAPQAGNTGSTFGIGPASATKVDGRPSFKWFATPGAAVNDHVAIVNLSTKPLTLDLYARDANNQASGALALQPKSGKPLDAGSWIVLEIPKGATTVTVPARSTIIVPLEVKIPTGASPGDHTGGVIASLTAQVLAGGSQQLNPDLEQRIAVPVAVRVSGPVHARLSVESLGASYDQTVNPVGEGRGHVTYTVVNTGNVNLGGHQEVTVHGLFGWNAHVKAPDIPVLLPGSSETFHVAIPHVAPTLLVTAKVAITALIPNNDQDGIVPTAQGTHRFWAVPWPLLGIVALLASASWFLRRRRRPGNARHGSKPSGGRRRTSTTSSNPSKHARVDSGQITVASNIRRITVRLASVAIVALAGLGWPVATASASSALPYTDPYANGYVGLCDKDGNNITHGSVFDKPFVWRAVSSVAAPSNYRADGRKATLYAIQPRLGTTSSEWNGDTLTAATTYTNALVPMVQATDRDFALSDFLDEYAPQWDRLLQLRMYFSAPKPGTDLKTYAASDIRVSGTTWKLVTGGNVDCHAGDATSPEQALPATDQAGLQPAQPLSEVAAKAIGAPVGASSSSVVSSPSHGHVALFAGLAAAVGVCAAGGWLWRRGRARGA